MNGSQIYNLTIETGTSVTLAQGFVWASITPASGATYTIKSDNAPVAPDINDGASAAYSSAFSTGNAPSQNGWDEFTIAATGGNVYVSYCVG